MEIRPFRILVTGTRNRSWVTKATVELALEALSYNQGLPAGVRERDLDREELIIVHGACPFGGVDEYADRWAISKGFIAEPHPAERDARGRLLGPERNARMVALGADMCVAFPDSRSRGTWDCARKASLARIPTVVYGV